MKTLKISIFCLFSTKTRYLLKLHPLLLLPLRTFFCKYVLFHDLTTGPWFLLLPLKSPLSVVFTSQWVCSIVDVAMKPSLLSVDCYFICKFQYWHTASLEIRWDVNEIQHVSQNNWLWDCTTCVGPVSQYELSACEMCVTLNQITVSGRICTGCGSPIQFTMLAELVQHHVT